MFAETSLVVVRSFWIILKTCLGHVFFFWPKSYKNISSDVVLITGGGKGLGRLIAVEFAKRKPRQIIIWGRNEDTLSATSKAIQMQGIACDYMVCDVADKDQVFLKAKEVKKRYGGVDILVNNAGVVFGRSLLECRADEVQYTINVNLLAQFWTIKSFLPSMLANNHGHIVFINSLVGLIGLGGVADYTASKFGSLGLFESLNLEIERSGKTGVHLTTIHPYIIDTDMFDGIKIRFPTIFPPLSKDYVAWKIVNAICTNKRFCIIPRYMYFFYYLKCVIPYDVLLILQRFLHLHTVMEGLQRLRNQDS